MKRWLTDLYRFPKRWAIYQAIFWGVLMFIAYIVRDRQSGREITSRVIVGGIVSVFIGAVVFGALMYWLRIRQMKNDGL